MQNDGFSLNANRDPIDDNDIPDLLAKWKSRDPKAENDQSQSLLCAQVRDRRNDYDLSINRYKEIEYEEVQYDPPKTIIAQLEDIDPNQDRDDCVEGDIGMIGKFIKLVIFEENRGHPVVTPGDFRGLI